MGRLSEARKSSELQPLDLLIEEAGESGCLAHVPTLPGFCFRAETVAQAKASAPGRIAEYVAWLRAERLTDLTTDTAKAAREGGDVRVAIAECVRGAPVWKSGNAATLFDADHRPLDDVEIVARLRVVRRVLDGIREAAAPLSASERAHRPAPNRRSIDETLEHIGNCIWWYCSRIDDDLPEPDEPEGESWLDRIDRLFDAAERYLPGVPLSTRAEIHVPTRFPTDDPYERWNHTKVCRRQAEHVWAHLPGMEAAATALRKHDT